MTRPARGIIGIHHRLKPTIKITWYAGLDPLFFYIHYPGYLCRLYSTYNMISLIITIERNVQNI